mmetsp:Transcript_7833/g.31728  ORF Transcript_7833/g.31728 Transcript_7833/m.31728 type:complete len:226 (-) Transcript_7833:2395-3072(-)
MPVRRPPRGGSCSRRRRRRRRRAPTTDPGTEPGTTRSLASTLSSLPRARRRRHRHRHRRRRRRRPSPSELFRRSGSSGSPSRGRRATPGWTRASASRTTRRSSLGPRGARTRRRFARGWCGSTRSRRLRPWRRRCTRLARLTTPRTTTTAQLATTTTTPGRRRRRTTTPTRGTERRWTLSLLALRALRERPATLSPILARFASRWRSSRCGSRSPGGRRRLWRPG